MICKFCEQPVAEGHGIAMHAEDGGHIVHPNCHMEFYVKLHLSVKTPLDLFLKDFPRVDGPISKKLRE